MINKMKFILLIFSLLFSQNFSSINSKITTEQKKMLSQAKSLQSSGLIDEAIIVYNNILEKFPTFREAFIPLKNIYISNKNWDALEEISGKYLEANKFNTESNLDVLDIYIITDNPKWENLAIKIYDDKPIKSYLRKKVLSILLNNNKEELVLDLVSKTRMNIKTKGFYSLELGIHFSMKFNFQQAVNEYLTYLENNPKNVRLTTQRIMLLTENLNAIDIIKNKLIDSELKESKIILSKLEFKLKNYNKSYNILMDISDVDKYKLELCEDLIKINNYVLAHKVINDILDSSNDKKILNKAISQLANLYEIETLESSYNFPISKDIYKNQILNSPFIEINKENSHILLKAINIYDSLSTYGNDYKSTLHLAEIKYRIQQDLDGSEIIYNTLLDKNLALEYKQKIITDLINISLARGELNNTFSLIDSLYNKINHSDLIQTINLKKLQTHFYNIDRDSLIVITDSMLKSISKENLIYNDLLSIKSLFSFYDNEELKDYINAQYKLIQNKRIEAINILDSVNIGNNIYPLSQYESAYLEVLEKNYSKALEKVSYLDSTENSYKERALILKGEIYDYGLNDKSMAVNIYLNFIELFPKSIFYDLIRLRLRELAL